MFVSLSATIVSSVWAWAIGKRGSPSNSPKVHVDCVKHGVTDDLMMAKLAAEHWQM